VLVPELWGPAVKSIFENPTRAILKGYPGQLFAAALTPRGWRILTGTRDGREDERVARVWDASNECEIAILKGHFHCASQSRWPTHSYRIAQWDGGRLGFSER